MPTHDDLWRAAVEEGRYREPRNSRTIRAGATNCAAIVGGDDSGGDRADDEGVNDGDC